MDAVWSGASLHGSVETVLIGPSVQKVTVKSVTLGISLSPEKSVEVLDGIDVVEELEKDGEDGYGVGLWAHTGVVIADSRECNLSILLSVAKVNTIGLKRRNHVRGSCDWNCQGSCRPSKMGRMFQREGVGTSREATRMCRGNSWLSDTCDG